MDTFWKDKRVLITGACGTVGSEIINQLCEKEVAEIVGIDNNENELFFIDQKYKDKEKVRFFLADIKNKEQLTRFFEGMDIAIHTAARKHVILNEIAPGEAIYTNIVGTQNIIDTAVACGLKKVIFTSSDKAVNPTNVMGTSKLMGERLMTAANAATRQLEPVFASTRFGNVLGSNGSVIPLFKKQILSGGPVTLTDPEMSRFVMTIDEAASLVLSSVPLARGGEVFVTKMPTIRIEDLAKAMISYYAEKESSDANMEIKIIGAKPGEKLYEELINEEEVRRTVEMDKYFAVLPAFKGIYSEIKYDYVDRSKAVDKIYRSDLEETMNVEALKNYLVSKNLLN